MVDLYLLTAPILLLAIVILLRFVGCTFTAGPRSWKHHVDGPSLQRQGYLELDRL